MTSPLDQRYAEARRVRIQQGQLAAVPLYRALLQETNDITTACRLAASPKAIKRLDAVCDDDRRARDLGQLCDKAGFHTEAIARRLQVPKQQSQAQAPIYVTPVAAGSCPTWPWVATGNLDLLDLMIALFLVGLAVPFRHLQNRLSQSDIDILLDLCLIPCEYDDTLIFSLVHVMPINLRLSSSSSQSLWIVTDWHPRVLAQTTLAPCQDAVMYIGPDSLALVQHWINNSSLDGMQGRPRHVLDVCTGSGIQALATLLVHPEAVAVCLDVNRRALRFASFNAHLNGIDKQRISFVWGDLLTGRGQTWSNETSDNEAVEPQSLLEILRSKQLTFDWVTGNPPFLPVPPNLAQPRHGLFSVGGPSGELILAAILELASYCLSNDGYLAVVSEFFLPETRDSGELRHRITKWFGTSGMTGLLLTNEEPIDTATYAARRSDSMEEFDLWLEHLNGQGIAFASPGFLFLRKLSAPRVRTHHRTLRKSKWGSIWTPSNPEALNFTSTAFQTVFAGPTEQAGDSS